MRITCNKCASKRNRYVKQTIVGLKNLFFQKTLRKNEKPFYMITEDF